MDPVNLLHPENGQKSAKVLITIRILNVSFQLRRVRSLFDQLIRSQIRLPSLLSPRQP